MALIDEIREDLKQAMLSKNKLSVSTLRLLVSAIRNKEIEKGEPLDNEEILATTSTEVKKRREASEEYNKANREDLAQKEEQEAKILQKYLPEQLTEADIEKIVNEAVDETKATSRKDMGKVMQVLMPKIKGRADGRKVSQLVSQKLES